MSLEKTEDELDWGTVEEDEAVVEKLEEEAMVGSVRYPSTPSSSEKGREERLQ